MLAYPDINPVAIALGSIEIHWYGLMYVIGFALAWALGRWQANRGFSALKPAQIDDLLFYAAIGVIVGGRLGYILFYQLDAISTDPMRLLRVWEGGMSFHGGLLGVLVAAALFARKTGLAFFTITDFVAPLVPIGLFFGRIGNFINAELWGKPTDAPWGMIFPGTDGVPRHPSMLYEAVLEGLVLFIILFYLSIRPRARMLLSGVFLAGYGSARFAVEFVREPDAHIGHLWGTQWLNMGHVLSAPMIIAGLVLIALALKYNQIDPRVSPQKSPEHNQ